MQRDLRHWWVTVLVDRQRTRDELIRSDSAYAAGWLYRQLHPGAEVINVRPVARSGED